MTNCIAGPESKMQTADEEPATPSFLDGISNFSWGDQTPMIRPRHLVAEPRKRRRHRSVNDGRLSMVINMILWMCFLINVSFIFVDRFEADTAYDDDDQFIDLALPLDGAFSFWLLIYILEFISLVM